MQTSGNTILITGGGSGIGLALAQRFLKAGNRVIITGRSKAKLDDAVASSPGLIACTLDVDDPQAVARFAEQITADHPDLNILINNAGIMHRDELTPDTLDLERAEAIITTNLLGPIRLTAALLPHLRTAANAGIVNVTSGLAFVPLVNTAAYCATKAAMHSYTQSLRQQLAGQGIEVIELPPPAVQTELTPGQSQVAHYMPLDAFADEVMSLFSQQPTPREICVENVKFLRNAEAEGRYDAAFEQLNAVYG